ncbi:unnamed protein product [Toxocara canis]|uniref:Transposase n=1 Tax=Toxocara canis TaxID=6265 RepID=A0A183U895_TOXCA|nr:unnamed protein product [Toxocara canis]
MNNSLERAHRSVEEGARALMHLVEETRGHVKKQLDSAYSARGNSPSLIKSGKLQGCRAELFWYGIISEPSFMASSTGREWTQTL